MYLGYKYMSLNLLENFDKKGEKIFNENIDSSNERILIKLKSSDGQGLVITSKRLYVMKWGFWGGNTFGGRCNAYEYANIVGIEIKTGWTTGTLEVLTPANQNIKTDMTSAIKNDNAVLFPKTKLPEFQEATRIGRELMTKHHSGNNNSISNLFELEKLAELKDKGIITQGEFDAKKKLILGL